VQAGAIGVIAIVCLNNLTDLAGLAPLTGTPLLACATALIACLAGANILGVRCGSRIQNITAFAKILTLGAIVAVAALLGRAAIAAPPQTPLPDQLSPFRAVLASLVPALFAFGGWQQALWISGEVKNPARTLPRAILIGVVLVIVVYL